MDMQLISIQVGLPESHGSDSTQDPNDRSWTTGLYKQPVSGPIWAGETNLEGDGQADLVNHGGVDKAVCVYSADHFPFWKTTLDLPDLPLGAFGENFTIKNIVEDNVCIGDIWNIGEATFQVSQPRRPCWKLSRRWRITTLTLQVQQSGRTGWYFRVIHEGNVWTGANCELVNRLHPEWPVSQANRVMHHDKHDVKSTLELSRLSALSKSWQKSLTRRIDSRNAPVAE